MIHWIIKIIIAIVLFTELAGCTRVVVVNGKSGRIDNEVDALVKLTDGAANDIRVLDARVKDTAKIDGFIKDGGLIGGNWVTIQAGTFIMGSPSGEACRDTYETQHSVTLTHAFEIQTTEVTQQQFFSLRGYNPSYFSSCGNDCPVEQVTWHEAAAYCNALSTNQGYGTCYDCSGSGSNVTCAQNASYISGNIYNCPGYRLPTEAEWEYAYRAGTTTSLHNNTNVVNCNSNDTNANAISWNSYNSQATPHVVGSTSNPNTINSWGLCDMAGNVWEWANDWWNGVADYGSASVTNPWGQSSAAYRVVRGGSWYYEPGLARAAYHTYETPAYMSNRLGFRCLKSK